MKLTAITNYIGKILKGESRELVSGSFISAFSKFLELVLRYGFLLLLARLVSTEEMGRYSLTIGTIMVMVSVGSLGLNAAMVKLVAPLYAKQQYGEVKTLYIAILKKILLSGAVMSILLYLFAEPFSVFLFQKAYLAPYFRAFALTLIPFLMVYFQAQAFRGARKIAFHAFANDLSLPIFNIAFLLAGSMLLSGGELMRFFYVASPITACILVTVLWIKLSKFAQVAKTQDDFSKEIWKTALPLVVSSASVQLLSWIDVFLIGRLYPDSDMAIYNIAMRVALFVSIPLIAIETSVAAQLSTHFKEQNAKGLAKATKNATLLSVALSIPIFLFLVLFGKYFLSIFGHEFVTSYPLMLVLLVGQFVNLLTGPVGLVLSITDRQKEYKNLMIAVSILSVILNILLIPQFGTWGAAWAIMIVTIVKNLSLFFAVKKYFGFYALDFRYLLEKSKVIKQS